MRHLFLAELQQLGDDLVSMAQQVEQAIVHAGNALRDQDIALAETVIAEDVAIDEMERVLDERCINLLAQQQPVATDLRTVVSGLRMSASLERQGDLARHIAQVTRARYPEPVVPEHLRPVFDQLDAAATSVAKQVTILLDTHDVELAKQIEQDDDLLDNLHQQLFNEVLRPEWTGSAQQTVDVTLLSRYYERFGDHAVALARRVVYLVTVEQVVSD